MSPNESTWTGLQAIHDHFFHDCSEQPQAGHGDRPIGCRSPAAVLGRVQGVWCEPADLDRLFRLRTTRVLNRGVPLPFHRWQLYGEWGLAGVRRGVAGRGDADTGVRDRHPGPIPGPFEADGRQQREVDEPRLFATALASPQPLLPALADLDWRPARRLAPYRPRRRRQASQRQQWLSTLEQVAASGG